MASCSTFQQGKRVRPTTSMSWMPIPATLCEGCIFPTDHTTLYYPLSGPIFQETKATDGSGHYLYLIDPSSYAVSRIGPYSGILGPYAVDATSSYAVNNVTNLWGMQVVHLKTGQIITANIPNESTGDVGLCHGIGWTPDQSEVWESSTWNDPHIYVWDTLNPMAPILKKRLALRSSRGAHWLTFDTRGGTMLMWRPTKIATKTPKYLTPAHTPP